MARKRLRRRKEINAAEPMDPAPCESSNLCHNKRGAVGPRSGCRARRDQAEGRGPQVTLANVVEAPVRSTVDVWCRIRKAQTRNQRPVWTGLITGR
jgi:hypothetical protein